MPVELHESLIELEIDALASVPIEPSHPGPSYPLPALAKTGARHSVEQRAVILENEHLSATVLIDLGGRLHSLVDKRTGVETLAATSSLAVLDAGPRGAWVESGIQIVAGTSMRPNSLGPVDRLVREPREPDEPGSLILHEIVPGLGLSWHATYSLAPDRAELEMDFRMTNRGFHAAAGDSGIRCAVPGGTVFRLENGLAAVQRNQDAGIVLEWSPGVFERAEWSDPALILLHDGTPGCLLGPRLSASWSLRIIPFSGLGRLVAASAGVAVGMSDDSMALVASRSRQGGKLFLLGGSGQSLEAPASLQAGDVQRFRLEGAAAAPVRWLLRDDQGADLVSWERARPWEPLANGTGWTPTTLEPEGWDAPRLRALEEALARIDQGEDPSPWLSMAAKDPRTRPASLVLLAMRALASGDLARADALLEDALGANAEDALAWWLKAVCQRRLGASEERPELLNAHFLAPLEPALRSEALLGQGAGGAASPGSVLSPLRDDPEALIEVACLLLDAGLADDASVWLDEAIRVHDCAMLRYLAAWNHLRASGMQAEAALHVKEASQREGEPPLPWRDLERRALRELSDRFPNDRGIRVYAQWSSTGRP